MVPHHMTTVVYTITGTTLYYTTMCNYSTMTSPISIASKNSNYIISIGIAAVQYTRSHIQINKSFRPALDDSYSNLEPMAIPYRNSFEAAPAVFSSHQGFQGYFYTEILTKYAKLCKDVINCVCLVDLQEGKLHFKKFAENGFKWNQEDYDHNGFRAVYCEKLFMTRSKIVYDVLFIYETHRWLPNLLYNFGGKPRSLKVASLGCGPAGELAGLEAYFSDLKVRHIKSLQASNMNLIDYARYSNILQTIQAAKLENVIGYDGAEGWKAYSETLGYTFQHQHIDQKFVEKMDPVDILILSYFAHNAGFSEPVEPRKYIWQINDFMRNWDTLQQKTRMIILIDTSASSLQTLEQLNKRGFGGIEGKLDSEGRLLTVRIWFRLDQWAS